MVHALVPRRRLARPGVKILTLADGRHVARFRDPLSGRQQQQSLDKLGLSNADARRQWAVAKSTTLAALRAAIASGSASAERVTLGSAITTFLSSYTKQSTIDGYQVLLDRFAAWAGTAGVPFVQDLTPPLLARYGDHCRQDKVAAPVRGGKRGAKSATNRRRSPASVNKALTVIKAFLGWARRRGWTPSLTGDGIRDSLRPTKMPRNAIRFLSPVQLKKLIAASLQHDRAVFKLTRVEHDGLRQPGTTLRNDPIAPFLLGMILTGCRFRELADLTWDEVDLEDGVIRLPAGRVKTGHARLIRLTETPSMARLLQTIGSNGREGAVFGMSRDRAEAARRRLVNEFKAPAYTWHDIRRSCGTILTNAPGVYGGASAFMSAKRLGHSVQIAERSYVGVITGLPRHASTLEAAAGIEALANAVIGAAASFDNAPRGASGSGSS